MPFVRLRATTLDFHERSTQSVFGTTAQKAGLYRGARCRGVVMALVELPTLRGPARSPRGPRCCWIATGRIVPNTSMTRQAVCVPREPDLRLGRVKGRSDSSRQDAESGPHWVRGWRGNEENRQVA